MSDSSVSGVPPNSGRTGWLARLFRADQAAPVTPRVEPEVRVQLDAGPGLHATRADSLHNVLSGLNTPGIDRTISAGWNVPYGDNRNRSNMTRYWSQQSGFGEAESRYISNGIAATIVDRPADDCFSRGIEIEGDDDDLMSDELDRLSVMTRYADAVRWARLFGASVIEILAKDSGLWEDPLDLDMLDIIEDLRVYDIRHVSATDLLYDDPTDPKYGKPEFYRIHVPGKPEYTVHETRLIMFTGDPLPIQQTGAAMIAWQGKSALQACIVDLDRYWQSLEWSLRLLERKQQGIYKFHGFGDLMRENSSESTNLMRQRLHNVDLTRSVLNTIAVDGLDEYTVLNLGLDGLQAVINEFQIALCASSGMPAVILFGKSTTGLNATGAGDLENYYSMVARIQNRVAKPALERLVSILWNQRELKSKAPDTWKVKFVPLWVPSEKEQADTELAEAQAQAAEATMLTNLVQNGILLPEEARKIIIEHYDDYGFSDAAPSTGGDVGYAESVGGDDETGQGDTTPSSP